MKLLISPAKKMREDGDFLAPGRPPPCWSGRRCWRSGCGAGLHSPEKAARL
ncbi:MAG: hypothetical protein ACLRIS_10575 [Flavonifractor plautii]